MVVGLIIGRFQPFHKGHVYLVRKALQHVDVLVIGIGSSNVHDVDNPLSYSVRKEMVEVALKREGLRDKLRAIVPIPDVPNDNEWLRITKEHVGKFDLSIGNNEWVNGIFEAADISILRVPYYKRFLYEGKRIRKLMREGRPWEGRIPDYLVPLLTDLLLTDLQSSR